MNQADVNSAQQIPQELFALLQLARRAREAESVEALGFIIVNESRQLLHYRQAALWLGERLGHVAAVSGVPQVETNAPYVQWLGELFRSQLAGGAQPRSLTAAEVSPAVAERWADWLPTHALWLPLIYRERWHGALLLAADEALPDYVIGLASEIIQTYAHALAAFAPRQTLRARLVSSLRPTRNRLLATLAVLAVAAFPVRQSVLAPAEVVPEDPFLVRAPLDGVIDRLLVQPNQAVTAGTPLFLMDTTALQARNDVARKAYDTAREEYRQSAQAAVTDDKSKLEVAQRRGELEQRAVELDYAADQLGRVQVKAERAGVAVFADVNDWQGKVVTLGERILTLADPGKLALSIDLPATESLQIQPGTRVTLYPNSDPMASYPARLTQIAYRAEPARDAVLAYRLKAEFDAGVIPPRIGLMGTAKVSGDRVPLIYFALRRPLTLLRQWFGW